MDMAKEKLQKKEKKEVGVAENNGNTSYEAKDIYVLEGLEPVRRRPGMYIGSTGQEGLHHLIWEVADNSLDEFMAGFGNRMVVALLPENRIRIEDNGRGIPVDIHPQTKKSALETVMCTLHAGGKFGGQSYKVAGGLHGVGVSVVNALSKWVKAEVCRNGFLYEQEYKKGKPVGSVKKGSKCDRTGTAVTFEPDSEVFKDIKFDWEKILTHLRQQAYLTKSITIVMRDQRDKLARSYTFHFEGGIVSYVKYLNKTEEVRHNNVFYVNKEHEEMTVEAAFQYTSDLQGKEIDFANNIHTPEGGMHATGFRVALTRTLNDYARKNGFIKDSDENLTGDDVREGLTAIISVKLREPQFEGQTKAKLGNPEARTAVESVLADGLQEYLEKNPTDARSIMEKCVLAAKARQAAKAARETVIRKGLLEGLALPGKLADCSSREPENSEIFIVEGDSAGGSCKQARDRHFQAILPLRGKIMNVEKARMDKMLASKEVKAIIIALGTAIAESFDINKLRYHRIILTLDADVDGSHIRTLLMTLFFRYFPEIIQGGYLYVAQPPLYRLQKGKEIKYAYSDEQKEEVLKALGKEGVGIQRYKGLGEMNPSQLWETTMDPKIRLMKQITVADAVEADKFFDILMGDEVAPRKRFIQTHAKKVKNLDI